MLIKLGDDKALDRELRTYLQTEQYASRKLDGTQPPTTVRILKERLADNRQRRERLTVLLGKLVNEADFYAAGKKLTGRGPEYDPKFGRNLHATNLTT